MNQPPYPEIAERHLLMDLDLRARNAARVISNVLGECVDRGLAVERAACIVEAGFAAFIRQHVRANYETDEEGGTRPHEVTLLLSGEIASDLIPHLKPFPKDRPFIATLVSDEGEEEKIEVQAFEHEGETLFFERGHAAGAEPRKFADTDIAEWDDLEPQP